MNVKFFPFAFVVGSLATGACLVTSIAFGQDTIYHKALVQSDFKLTTASPWENTLVALAPGENTQAPLGVMVLSAGQNAYSSIYARNLYLSGGGLNTVDSSGVARGAAFLHNSASFDGTDNQIIKLPGGALLAMRNATTWQAMNNPPWWASEKLIFAAGFHQGQRGSINLYKSTDGGASWPLLSSIDFGSEKFRAYGTPRPLKLDPTNPNNTSVYQADVTPDLQSKDPSGQRYWWIGGGDRPELYRCPFTGNIYITTRNIAGTIGSSDHLDEYLLLYSTDNGVNWNIIADNIPGWESLVMTSTPDGKLFLFHEVGSTPLLYYTLLQPDSTLKLSQGYPVFSTNDQTGVSDPVAWPDQVSIDRLQVGTPSMCRISEHRDDKDTVLFAYQGRDPNNNNNQVYKLVTVVLTDKTSDAPPESIKPFATISGSDPANYSVMHGTFIEPDFLDMPSSVLAPLTMFYWIEAPRVGSMPSMIKGCLLTSQYHSYPFPISTRNNALRTLPSPVHIGDYMKGAFYWYNNRYHFIAQWPEANGIHCNIISAGLALEPETVPVARLHSAPLTFEKIYPNPFPNSAAITFSTADLGFTQVRILNLLGVVVAQLYSGELEAGEHSFTWDAKDAPPGMYIARIVQGNSIIAQKIIKY